MPPPMSYFVSFNSSTRTPTGRSKKNRIHMEKPPYHASAVSVAVLSRSIASVYATAPMPPLRTSALSFCNSIAFSIPQRYDSKRNASIIA